MTRSSALSYVYSNLLALVFTVLFAIGVAEGRGGGQNSSRTSPRNSPSSLPTPSNSGSKKPKPKKIQDKNSKVTRCYDERMVEIPCPVSKSGKIAGYVVCGIFGIILLFVLYKKLKGKVSGKREDLEANNHELEEEDTKTKQMLNDEKDDSSSSDIPPPQYIETVADEPQRSVTPLTEDDSDLNPSGPTTPPTFPVPVPQPAQTMHDDRHE